MLRSMNSNSFKPFIICDTLSTATPGLRCLAAMESATLPDGCHVYCDQNRTLYVLDKSSEATASGGIVTAVNGGRWIPQQSATPFGGLNVRNTQDKTVALTTINSFAPLTAAASSYGSLYVGGGWSIDTSSGIATWNGPDNSVFLFTGAASMWNNTTVIDTAMGLGVSFGGSPYAIVAQGRTTSPVATGASSYYALSFNTVVTLDQGDAIQMEFAGEAASTLTVVTMNYSLIQMF